MGPDSGMQNNSTNPKLSQSHRIAARASLYGRIGKMVCMIPCGAAVVGSFPEDHKIWIHPHGSRESVKFYARAERNNQQGLN
jgi:hypothetical protein